MCFKRTAEHVRVGELSASSSAVQSQRCKFNDREYVEHGLPPLCKHAAAAAATSPPPQSPLPSNINFRPSQHRVQPELQQHEAAHHDDGAAAAAAAAASTSMLCSFCRSSARATLSCCRCTSCSMRCSSVKK